jgi:hypothetical protein
MNVFKLSKNSLIPCGSVEINTGSYPGNESAIMRFLANEKHIPKTFQEGYYKMDNGKFTISQI